MSERNEPSNEMTHLETPNQHELVQSIIPTLGQPSVESVRYVLDLQASMTEWQILDYVSAAWGERKLPEFWQADVRVGNPEKVSRFLAQVASKVAWLEFYARPQITVKQSDLAMEHGRHYYMDRKDPSLQKLEGDRFSVGSVYYATDFDPATGVTLHTHEQIVAEGSVTPYMEEWLSRILHKENRIHPSHSYLKPFAGWLKSTRPDLDIPDYLTKE